MPKSGEPVRQASPGNVHKTVAPGTASTLAPVAVSAAAHFGNGVSVSILSHRTITVRARRPGEISGHAIRIEIAIRNGSQRAVSIGNTVVSAQDAGRTPFVQFMSSPSAPVSGSLAVGERAIGDYVFELPAHFRNPLTLSVTYSTALPVALFVGDAE